MKKLFFSLILFLPTLSYCQTVFDRIITEPNKDSYVTDVFQDVNNNIFITGFYERFQEKGNSFIIKLSDEGDILAHFKTDSDSSISYTTILPSETGLTAIGHKGVGNLNKVILNNFDYNLNKIWEHEYTLFNSNTSFLYSGGNYNKEGEMIFYGDIITDDSQDKHTFISRYSNLGDSLSLRLYLTTDYQFLYHVIQNQVSDSYWGSGYGFDHIPGLAMCDVIKYKSNFEIDTVYLVEPENYPYDRVWGASQIKFVTDTTFLYSSRKLLYDASGGQNEQISIQLYDTTFMKLKETSWGTNEAQSNYFPLQGLDFINSDNVFVGGIAPFDRTDHTENYNMLTKLDSNLDIVWTKFYGGDASYRLNSVVATQDGGCIMVGKYQAHDMNTKDIIVIKVDADGNTSLTSKVKNIKSIKATEQIIYPNPGDTELHIKTAIQKVGGEFILSDISGKVALQTTIINQETTLHTQKLLSGVYFYSYFYENKKLESGKWVKE